MHTQYKARTAAPQKSHPHPSFPLLGPTPLDSQAGRKEAEAKKQALSQGFCRLFFRHTSPKLPPPPSAAQLHLCKQEFVHS